MLNRNITLAHMKSNTFFCSKKCVSFNLEPSESCLFDLLFQLSCKKRMYK